MAAPKLRKLRQIQGNLAKLVKDKNALRSDLKDYFQDWLNQGQRRFQNRLKTASVSDQFPDTIASRRLYRSFNTDINSALKIGRNGALTFAFGIKSSGRRNDSDPSQYYAAIDDASNRRVPKRGYLNLGRVIDWLYERGIAKRGRKTVTTRKGKRTPLRSFAFAVQTAIIKKTINRGYKSLRLTEMLADIIDIRNPESDFRVTLRGKVSNLVLAGVR